MKRFRELVADTRQAFPNDDFFATFESNCRTTIVKHYRTYNDALMTLDDKSWDLLKIKTIGHFRNERDGQRKQGFFNQLNEAFAYRHLLNKGFKDVRFIEEGRERRPDIHYVDGGSESYCEVKTVCISNDEIKRRASSACYDSAVYIDLSGGFLNKLDNDIAFAWKQIKALGKEGLVFVLIQFDDIALDHYERYRKQLTKFSQDRRFENLIMKVGYRGSRRICKYPNNYGTRM